MGWMAPKTFLNGIQKFSKSGLRRRARELLEQKQPRKQMGSPSLNGNESRAKVIYCAGYDAATGPMELALVSGRPTRRNRAWKSRLSRKLSMLGSI